MSGSGTEDRGSFTHAVCRACGWRGPGRRARATAERDLELHDLGGCPMEEAELAEGARVPAPEPLGPRVPLEAGAAGGSQAHGIPVAVGEGGVAPGRERLTAHGRS
ncbi:hypothetical protein [Oryzihumus sp.]|uniref:hypothetical protein n=1 Tax=Oryzihumus sp. TaxID=1968903 RepID=UPI002ED866B8